MLITDLSTIGFGERRLGLNYRLNESENRRPVVTTCSQTSRSWSMERLLATATRFATFPPQTPATATGSNTTGLHNTPVHACQVRPSTVSAESAALSFDTPGTIPVSILST